MKELVGTLLMFLFVIAFTSCSDDDKPKYHLELSRNSCEVMKEYSVAIDLIAHENTTLDIEKPELIDAVYTWGFDGNKARIEIKGKQKGETLLVVTDHETGESATIKVKVTEHPLPRLAVKQPKGNIFDMMDFYLYNEDSSPVNAGNLSEVCDSIVWMADGVNGSFSVFEHESGKGGVNNQLTWMWGHCFKYPGEYKTNLTAWKDNKVIYSYRLDVTVVDDKDFLHYNWSDITQNLEVWESYADVFGSSPELKTAYGLGGTVPYAEGRVWDSNMARSYQALYDYLCKIYSAPTYEDKTEKQKMWQLYNELFSEQKKYSSAYPDAIWVTKRATIVLLFLDESTEYPGYVIYAEPNRQ